MSGWPPHFGATSVDIAELKQKSVAELHDAGRGAEHHQLLGPPQAGPDLPHRAVAARLGHGHPGRGRARDPARGLRIPAQPGLELPLRPRRHLRLARARSSASTCAPATRSWARCGRRRRGSATSRCSRSRASTSRSRRRPSTGSPSTTCGRAIPTAASGSSASTGDLSMRVIDLLSPIGKGQRGLIVAPPKAGKTILLQKLANAITENHPEVVLIVLLIDERPEEVTDMEENVEGGGHRLHLRRAGRPARAGGGHGDREGASAWWSTAATSSSCSTRSPAWRGPTTWWCRTRARSSPAAWTPTPSRSRSGSSAPRATSTSGGSLTIIATALIETGSRMDEVIFEEFKGTGNMELVLDRRLADRRIYPAIDVQQTSHPQGGAAARQGRAQQGLPAAELPGRHADRSRRSSSCSSG